MVVTSLAGLYGRLRKARHQYPDRAPRDPVDGDEQQANPGVLQGRGQPNPLQAPAARQQEYRERRTHNKLMQNEVFKRRIGEIVTGPLKVSDVAGENEIAERA
jgi:hypothetical protein